MGRPSTISSEQIIQSAQSLFLSEGPSVSTARIAANCGISEGTLFKRFGNKNQLFMEAMNCFSLERPLQALRSPTNQEDPVDSLIRISLELLSFFRILIPRMMTIWASHSMDPRQFLQGEESPPKKLLDEVTLFLEQQDAEGKLQIEDAEVVARMLLSTMHNLAFFETMGLPSFKEEPEERYVRRMLAVMGLGKENRKA